MTRRRLARFGVALLLVAAAPSLVSCSARRAGSSDQLTISEPASAQPVLETSATTAAVVAGSLPASSTAADQRAAVASGAPAAPSGRAGLDASEAAALDAELSAIEAELDRLSLPSDDYSDLESGLK